MASAAAESAKMEDAMPPLTPKAATKAKVVMTHMASDIRQARGGSGSCDFAIRERKETEPANAPNSTDMAME